MFEEHLRLFPQSEKASAALYFLGRHAELASRYPLSYYTTLVRNKPKRSQWRSTSSRRRDEGPTRTRPSCSKPPALPEWAEVELQWAAQNEANPTLPRWRSPRRHPGEEHTTCRSGTSRGLLPDT